MKAPTKLPRHRACAVVCILVLVSLAVPLAALADDTEEMLVPRFSIEGHYGLVAAGVGMLRNGSPGAGTIEIDVPGTSVRAAYIYWSGHGPADTGDCVLELRRESDGETLRFSADPDSGTFGPAYWFDGYFYWVHAHEVTPLVETGRGRYTVSDYGQGLHRRDGAGLIVVYEDAALPLSRVEIRDGLDRFYRPWGEGPRGETAVNCTASGTPAGDMDLWLFAAEVVRQGEEEPRPNALWYLAGSGPQPVDLVNAASGGPVTGTLLQGPPDEYPFASRDGLQWDTFHGSLPLADGDDWVCLQVESAIDPRDADWRPASGVLLAQAACLPLGEPPVPTVVPSPTPPKPPTPYTPQPPLVPEASTLLLLGSSAATLVGYAALQWRARRRD
jgi:hypothetical protein